VVVNPLTLRIAFMLTLASWRTVQGPAVATWNDAYRYGRSRLFDPAESDSDLSEMLSDATGSMFVVTTYSGAFECRLVQINWTRASTSLLDEDVAVSTIHLLKVSGGTPVDTWDAADFEAARDAVLAFWTAIKTYYMDTTKLVSVKFYREGPSIEPPQPPVFSHELAPAVAGVQGGGLGMFPPQVALSVTEKTSIRKSWGRMYLPAPATHSVSPAVELATQDGRVTTSFLTAVADAADTMYQAFLTASTPAVVYRRPLPERQDADGDTLDARDASALSVDQLQLDNIWDVIRSRRYDRPSLRVQRDIS
jgi:hypothetical protein